MKKDKDMTPNEYYRESAKVLSKIHGSNSTSYKLKESRSADPEYIKELEEIITKKHSKFPIPVLDISDNAGQEGLHRMMVVGNLYGWNTKFPVLLVENYLNAKPEEVLEQIINNAKERSYNSLNEVIHTINKLLLNSIFHEDFDVNFNNNETQIVVIATYNDKDYTAYEDTSEFDVAAQEINQDKELDKLFRDLDL